MQKGDSKRYLLVFLLTNSQEDRIFAYVCFFYQFFGGSLWGIADAFFVLMFLSEF
jgi:hypothetical protein